MTEALYEDAGLVLDDDGITIRRYYFLLSLPKRVAYNKIRGIRAKPMSWVKGNRRLVGALNPRYRLPRDVRRATKQTLLILELGRWVKPCITPEDPARVIALLRDRVRPN
ncbi:MAG: hypothetical protein WBZ37_10675 [Mycobacterium sp.]